MPSARHHGALVAALACATAFCTTSAAAQSQNYPNKPIRIVNTVAAGGPAEVIARIAGQRITEAWGQQVVVDSRPGAAGIIGAELVARATPDGYTLLLGSGATMVFAPLLQKETPYAPLKDFAFVSMMVKSPMVLVAHPSVQANNIREFVQLAKAKPGYYNFGSLGIGSTPHLGGELLKMHAGIDIQHIAYKGGLPAVTALVGGEVQLLWNSTATALPHVKSGRLRMIGTGGTQRSPLMPETPTIAETYPGFEVVTWYGVVAPMKTPKDIVAKLNAEITKGLRSKEVNDRLIGQGHDPQPGTPEDMRKYTESELTKWAKIVKAADITLSH